MIYDCTSTGNTLLSYMNDDKKQILVNFVDKMKNLLIHYAMKLKKKKLEILKVILLILNVKIILKHKLLLFLCKILFSV